MRTVQYDVEEQAGETPGRIYTSALGPRQGLPYGRFRIDSIAFGATRMKRFHITRAGGRGAARKICAAVGQRVKCNQRLFLPEEVAHEKKPEEVLD